MKPFVYVAGPIASHPMHNAHIALKVCRALVESGVIVPFSPHASVLWDMVAPMDYEQWMEYDLDVIAHMDGVLRMEGESPGADREVAFAQSKGIPVFFDVGSLVDWGRQRTAEPDE